MQERPGQPWPGPCRRRRFPTQLSGGFGATASENTTLIRFKGSRLSPGLNKRTPEHTQRRVPCIVAATEGQEEQADPNVSVRREILKSHSVAVDVNTLSR